MSLLNATLQDLAKTFSLPHLQLDHAKQVTLSIGDMGDLSIEQRNSHIILRLSKAIPQYSQISHKALELCKGKRGNIFPIRAGIYKDTFSFLVLFSEQEFTLQNVLQSLTFMNSLYKELGV